MEAFGLYLLKSAIWLTGFTIVFLMFLRNERYFELNRAYLLSGIFASIVFPFYTWHYAVILPSLPAPDISIPDISDQVMVSTVTTAEPGIPVYWWLYILGIAYFSIRLIWQTVKVIGKLRKTGYVKNGPVKLVRTPEYSASFSFFSFVFVNPSTSDIEMKEIVNHESGHIQKRHWFDLLLVELLCMLQWFNPFAWIYSHLVRQNHEYMADEMALKRTSNPAIYQATLLNQMLGVPVISLANSFSYSLNKQRFKMMKKKINSPFRKLRMLMVLPLIAMVFYAFAKPEYRYAENDNPKKASIEAKVDAGNLSVSSENSKVAVASKKSDAKETTQKEQGTVKGKVTTDDGKPLQGATIVVRGTTTGTVTDADGNFKLINISKDAELNISYVGMDSKSMKADFDHPMNFKLDIVTIGIGKVTVNADQPETSRDEENPPMYILDGKIIDKSEMLKIKPDDIFEISVLKDKSAVNKFGEKAKNGAVIIISKTYASTSEAKKAHDLNDLSVVGNADQQKTKSEAAFQVVEQMPQFPGGARRLMYFLSSFIKYPAQAKADKVEGTVAVNFLVSSTGKIEKVKVIKSVNPELDAEAVRVISLMPAWNPGKQGGKPVEVYYTIPIEFSLKSADEKSQDAKQTSNAKSQKGDVVHVAYGIQQKKPFIPLSKEEEKPFVVVEQMPQFPGGEKAMMEFIKDNLKYPIIAKEKGVSGVVLVNFVIGSDGKIGHIKVVRKVGSECDEEAVRILNLMPNWLPGKQGGKAVTVTYTVPIKFSLDSSTKNSGADMNKIPPPPPPVTKDAKPFAVVKQMPQNQGGGILILPRRVIFEGTKKSIDLNLINNSKDTVRYTMGLINYQMNEYGSFMEIKASDTDNKTADKYLHLSTQSILIGPEDEKSINISLTGAGGLTNGEYRSHLYFRSVSKEEKAFGYSIPVIIRIGELSAKVSLSDIKLEFANDIVSKFEFTFNRSGNKSVYGDLQVNHISPQGKSTSVGNVKGIAIYTPNLLRRFDSMKLDNKAGINYHSGKLQLIYSSQDYNEKYAEAELTLQ